MKYSHITELTYLYAIMLYLKYISNKGKGGPSILTLNSTAFHSSLDPLKSSGSKGELINMPLVLSLLEVSAHYKLCHYEHLFKMKPVH